MAAATSASQENTRSLGRPLITDEEQIRQILTDVYAKLKVKGYNPTMQIVGYLLTDDPTYITNHEGARTQICKIDRDEALSYVVAHFIKAELELDIPD